MNVAGNEHGPGDRVQPDRTCSSRENDAWPVAWPDRDPAGMMQYIRAEPGL
jgi:hypothetical protein